MNNFLDIELRTNFYVSSTSESTLCSDLMALGYFIKVDKDNFSDVVDAVHIKNHKFKHSRLVSLAERYPFILSRRHKIIIKKALILRVFNYIYNSDIKAKDFISFLHSFRSYRYDNNLSGYDFNNLLYGYFIPNNSNGRKEFAIAKYTKLTDVYSQDELLEIINDFYLFCVTNCDENILPFVTEAILRSVNEEN